MLVDSDHHILCVADLSIVVIFHQVVMCHRNIRVRVLLNKINLQVLFIVCFVYISCKNIIIYRHLLQLLFSNLLSQKAELQLGNVITENKRKKYLLCAFVHLLFTSRRKNTNITNYNINRHLLGSTEARIIDRGGLHVETCLQAFYIAAQ